MPERLDRVLIQTSRRTVELPWDSRDQLLAEIRHLEAAKPIRDAFAAVGASRPVPLSREQQMLLYQAINVWSGNVTVDGLPAGVWDLRNALADEFHDVPNPDA